MKHEIERFGSVSCKHRDLPKHNNWPFISDDRKKWEKFWLAVSIGLTIKHAAKGPPMSRIPLFNAATHNHKPQLGPQHVITMTKCG